VSEYDNTNRGVLFKNNQGDNPKRPQYRGSLNVNGADFNISAWIKESRKDGSKFMSLSVEPKRDKPVAPKPKQLTEDNWATAELNDDMPF
jgi:uncharacterized protein (DUF736 family)